MSEVAINTFLRPLLPFLNEEGVSEISINQPQELWIEKRGEMIHHSIPELDFSHLRTLSNLIAKYTEQKISEETPLLSATIPGGYRIQIVLPPAVENNHIALSIRKQALLNLNLDDYERLKAFDWIHQKKESQKKTETKLRTLIQEERYKDFIKEAILAKQNILISAGTSTGKTTFLNACLKEIPKEERILSIEDAREIKIPHSNRVHLISSRGGQGLAKVTPQELLEASLRLRPDRIILGELRGAEAFSYLRAINSGHPGSLTSIHADSPSLAFDQLTLMVLQANLGIKKDEILEYVQNIIPIVIQLKRGKGGYRYVEEIFYKGN